MDQEEEEEFECQGGDEEDEDSEPACHVSGADPFSSNALFSMATGGFESKSQQDTFKWQQQTDMVKAVQEEPCEESLLPDSFWIDICSNMQGTTNEKLVNLAMNPEKNTAYNGTQGGFQSMEKSHQIGPICSDHEQNVLQDVGMKPWIWSAWMFVALSFTRHNGHIWHVFAESPLDSLKWSVLDLKRIFAMINPSGLTTLRQHVIVILGRFAT